MAELNYLLVGPLIKFPMLVNNYRVQWKRVNDDRGNAFYRPEGDYLPGVKEWWEQHVGVYDPDRDEPGMIRELDPRVRDLPNPAINPRVIIVDAPEPNEKREEYNPNTIAGFFQLRKHKGLFGLEIEVEGKNLPDMRESKLWKADKDNSLRGENREYILRKPVDEATAKVALTELNAAFEKNKTVKDFSFRTSVHVHVNVQDMTKNEIARFVYLAHLLEAPLVHFSGAHREGNRFCLRGIDAAAQYDNLEALLFGKGFNTPDIQQAKYAAINLVPIKDLGSVEFRSMRGTCDTDLIMEWLAILNRIRTIALKFHSVKEIADLYIEKGPAALFKKVFTPNQRKLLKYPEMEEKIRTAFSYMINIPYMYKEA